MIDLSRDLFSKVSPYITHEAIELVIRKWNAAKQWFSKVEEEEEEAPEVESCELVCDSPKQYSLPCKCWLFSCIPEDIPITLSLIHLRWLNQTPQVVVGWKMTFDESIKVSDYHIISGLSTDPGVEAPPRPPIPTTHKYER
jgi:hypothetical protein